ncbi:MAG: ABC transporter family substrate-binding protein [Microbacteriaceae bacterium]|nr:ABC transporter family substrate-binding protein [Microbacteriaceae bacterium]
MKTKRILASVAAVGASVLVLSGCALPYQSEVIEGTSITVGWNDIASEFNPASASGNNVANSIPAYIANSGFNYYNATPELLLQETFGTYEKTSDDPLTVKYTINDAVKWSDGVDVDGADMLLSWVAGFGYFKSGEEYTFIHAAPRDDLASTLPTVNGRSLEFVYDKKYVDWEINFGVGVSAHGTVMLAHPEITDPAEAKSKFIEAVTAGDTEWIQAVADVWNTGYQVTDASAADTDPTDGAMSKVFLSNGPYRVEEVVADSYVTLVANPLYTWGPSPKYERITIREIADPTAAVQAVDNGDVQVASGQPTADLLALVEGLQNGSFTGGDEAAYEHVDLTFNNGGPFDSASYGGDEAKALAARQAFLLTIPRDQILDTIIKPLNPNAELRNSLLTIPGSPNYGAIVAANGSDFYSGTDAERVEKAKGVLSDAGISTPIDVKFWYPEGNVRRGQEFELIQANSLQAGFNVIDSSEPDWEFTDPSLYPINPHDAVIFAWSSTSLAITGNDQQYGTGKPSNFQAYANSTVDENLSALETELDPAAQVELQTAVEAALWGDAASLPIFQFPGLTWWDNGTSGVVPNPLSPNYFWNFWEWSPTAAAQ